MRKTIFTTIAFMTSSLAFGQDLIISEIVDATLPGGLPKYVELTNCGNSTIDLSGFSIANISNANTTISFDSTPLTGLLAAGDSYVISYEGGDSPGVGLFFSTYGFDPDNFDQGSFINGDDRIVLFQGLAFAGDPGDGTMAPVQDVYGVQAMDGTGEVWEYTDGYAFRNPGCSPTSVFDPNQWTFGGADSLEDPGGDDVIELALILSLTTPGTHTFVVGVPVLGGLGLALMALGMVGTGALGLRRRR